jgi:hypothetical protein
MRYPAPVEVMVMQYYLDISKAKLPFIREGDPTRIPLREGRYHCEYDVDEDKLPVEFVDRMRSCLIDKMDAETIRQFGDELEQKPVGFDYRNAKKLVA